MTIDTLAYTKHLVEKGRFNQEQAEALVEAQRDYVLSDLGTKEHLRDLERNLLQRFDEHQRRIDIKFQEQQTDIWKTAFVVAGFILAGVGLLIKLLV